jgi:hypothetical protein
MSDNDLIELILEKDADAIEFFYDKYSPLIYGLICTWLPDSANRQQILYEVFIGFHARLAIEKSVKEGIFISLYRLARKRVMENEKLENR